jgi:hypothetical protein
MEHIIVVNGFKIRKLGKNYEYSVNVFGQGQFSMLSDDSIKQELDEANQIYHEDEYFAVLKNACVKVLRYNDFYFDDVDIIGVGG